MEQKTFKIVASILAMVFLLNLASALSITNSPSKIALEDGSFNFTVDSNNTLDINLTSNIGDDFTYSTSTVIDGNNTVVNVTYQTNNYGFRLLNDYYVDVKVDDNGTIAEKRLAFENVDYCEGIGNEGKLDIEIEDFKVYGYGDEDDYWYLMDEIEVEVTIENNGREDVENIEIEWELYTEDGELILDDTESKIDIKDGDDETVVFTIKLDKDMDEFEGKDAVLYVKAIGEIKDGAFEGEETCEYDSSRKIDVITEDNFVVVKDIKFNSEKVEGLYSQEISCDETVVVSGRLYNIGEDDQDDVYLEIYSSSLEIYEKIEFSEIEAFDYSTFTYNFNLPESAQAGRYKISFEVFDEDGDIYENGEDDESKEIIQVDVAQDCKVEEPVITTSLENDLIEGKEAVVKTTIVNPSHKDIYYTVSAQGFEEWAKLTKISEEIVLVEAQGKKDVELTFAVNEEAAGEKEFEIVTAYNENMVTQPVTLFVMEGSKGIDDYFVKENLQIGAIILLNLILIVLIVIVAKKILRRK